MDGGPNAWSLLLAGKVVHSAPDLDQLHRTARRAPSPAAGRDAAREAADETLGRAQRTAREHKLKSLRRGLDDLLTDLIIRDARPGRVTLTDLYAMDERLRRAPQAADPVDTDPLAHS